MPYCALQVHLLTGIPRASIPYTCVYITDNSVLHTKYACVHLPSPHGTFLYDIRRLCLICVGPLAPSLLDHSPPVVQIHATASDGLAGLGACFRGSRAKADEEV